MGWGNSISVIKEDVFEEARSQLELMENKGLPGGELGEECSGLVARNSLLSGGTEGKLVWRWAMEW
jgi:hypothetical protein